MLKFFKGSLEKKIELAKSGDADAFAELVQQHCGMVYTIAYARLKNREAAEDLTQEVFLRIYLNLEKLAEPRFFTTWTSRIARNLAADWVKREQRRSSLLPLISLEELGGSLDKIHEREVQHALNERDVQETAEAAILQLPDDLREVLLLHYAEGLTLKQIARVREVHPTTVGRQVDQALAQVRKTVNETNFRRTTRNMASGRKLAVRSAATVATVAVLSSQAKSAIAAAAVLDHGLYAGVKTAGAGLSTGWKAITAAKAIAVVTAVTAVGGGGLYFNHQNQMVAQVSPKAVSSAIASAPASNELDWAVGHWIGKLQFPRAPKPIHVVFVVSQSPDGTLETKGRSPDQGFGILEGVPARVNGDTIRLEYPSARNAVFEGKQQSTDSLKGTFTQDGQTLPLTLKRFTPIPTGQMKAPAVALQPGKLQDYPGTYAYSPNSTASIVLRGERLLVGSTDLRGIPLTPVGDDAFVFDDRMTLVKFGRNGEGRVDRLTFHTEISDGKSVVNMRRLR